MSQAFKRTAEDFYCGNCGTEVKGNGYTNHCPQCLWSKHVDVFPGDRAEACKGMMEPVAVRATRDGYGITHRCTRCGAVREVKSVPEDERETLLTYAGNIAPPLDTKEKE